MQVLKEKLIRDFLGTHLIFAIIAATTLLIPFQAAISVKLLVVVIIYSGMIVIVSYLGGYDEWKRIWVFTFILSLLMMFPDWFLADTLGALQFPDDGFPMIGGSIPVYMAGLWVIPFFIIVFIGRELQKRRSVKIAYGTVSILSVLIFALAELTLVSLPSWSATVSGMIGNLAIYIILPELILGLSVFICYNIVRERPIWMMIIGAFSVMVFYIGNASFFFFIVETLLLGV